MTQDYAASMAKGALSRLEGVESLLPGNDRLIISLDSSGERTVHAVTTSVSGAQTAYVFKEHNGHIAYQGNVIIPDEVA